MASVVWILECDVFALLHKKNSLRVECPLSPPSSPLEQNMGKEQLNSRAKQEEAKAFIESL